MQLKNSFTVPRPPDEAWALLLDVPAIVGCVPGAELTGSDGDNSYKGFVAVKLGPVALKFAGTAAITDIDAPARTATIRAKGSDNQGRGNAGAISKMRVEAGGEGSLVTIETDLQLSGMVAQYGRASGVIIAVSNEIVAAFARCLKARLEIPAETPSRATATAAPASSPTAAVSATPRAATTETPKPAPAAPPSSNQLGAGLFLRAFLAWLRGLFGGGRAS